MQEVKKELHGSELKKVTGGDRGEEEDMSRCLRCNSSNITVTGAGTSRETHRCNACGWTWHNISDYALG